MPLDLFLIALAVFFVIDMLWLGVVARRFYRRQLGHLMRRDVNWAAAVTFYAIFVAGLVVFVIEPAVAAGSWTDAVVRGGFFGLVTYATFDLTALATLRDWPLQMTLVDIAWGIVLAASVATITYGIDGLV